jgi:signal transduction histidine kinase
VVYARARGLAREGLEEALRLHAETLASLLEVGRDGVEFEAKPGTLREFQREGSGSFAAIHGPRGEVLLESPSLGDASLPPPPPWEPGLLRYEELEAGPGGIPCAMVTGAFLAQAGDAAGGNGSGWTPPPEEERRFLVQVALDSRGRDRGLAELALFLVAAGAAALVLTGGAGLLLARAVLRPVGRMTREAAALTPGDPGRRLHPDAVVEELHSLAATLNAALDRLDDALGRQRAFTADASHELRTPVSVLMAGTELLLRRPRTPEEYREGLERQLRTIRRMKGIAENLLALARADAGAEAVERAPVRLDEVLGAALDEQAPLADAKGVRLVRDLGGPAVVEGSRRQLALLAGNLLSNAIKFAPEGGEVAVRLAAGGGLAEAVVSDNGPGIPPEHRERVFDRFHRVRGGSDPSEGAGLGLSIAAWVAKGHGGTIAVEERPGGGALLRVRLPLAAPRPIRA